MENYQIPHKLLLSILKQSSDCASGKLLGTDLGEIAVGLTLDASPMGSQASRDSALSEAGHASEHTKPYSGGLISSCAWRPSAHLRP